MSDSAQTCRIGVDVGGTFTDLVLVETGSGSYHIHKEPSTPSDPARAVVDGLDKILARTGKSAADVSQVIHGTTLGLNAIIQRKGAPTALVVSRGSRDVLELARARMADPLDLYLKKEEPLVPRERVFEVDFRLDRDGHTITTPDDGQLDALAHQLRRADVKAVAIVLLNSFRAPTIELAFARKLSSRLGDLVMVSSSDIWPEIREYERAMVAVMNAYIAPLMGSYLRRLQRLLVEKGFKASLLISTSNGGVISADTAARRPIDTVLSGPAAGVVGAADLSLRTSLPNLITVDMGGTSSDMAIVTRSSPEHSLRARVGDYPMLMPVVGVSAIGAGGGSIVWIDSQGVLKVGPESAGAYPGPVCYQRSGTRPTVTDCYLVTGILAEDAKLGGAISLDKAAARRAIAELAGRLGQGPGQEPEVIAFAALAVATSKMAAELRKNLAQRGVDPKDYVLLPFGGAGPTQAVLIAEEVGLDSILIPPTPGAFCALGAVVSDLKRDFTKALRLTFDRSGTASQQVREAMDELRSAAVAALQTETDEAVQTEFSFVADMRYVGQAFELTVEIPDDRPITDERLSELLHTRHQQVYGYRDDASLVQIISLRCTIIGRAKRVPPRLVQDAETRPQDERTRQVFFGESWQDFRILARSGLSGAGVTPGPCVIEQEDTTILVPRGWSAEMDRTGNIHVRRKGA